MRQALKDQEVGLDPHFRYRGKNQTRVETFSDAAFALAITLVVLSASVPTTFAELKVSLKDVVPFGLCVTLVMVIWYQHYLFFLRYGLQNTRIIVYNTMLIFLILVYVFPLKFLFRVLTEIYIALFTGNKEIFRSLFSEVITPQDTRLLMVIYGLGAAFIYGIFTLMYKHALRQKTALKLNEYEVFITKTGFQTNLLLASVPLVSVFIAITGWFGHYNFMVAGLSYLLYPPVMIFFGRQKDKQSLRLFPNHSSR